MRKYIVVPILVLLGGVGAFLMRLAQVRAGFEAFTGLPVAGDPWQYLLPAFLLVLAALLALAVLRAPEHSQQQPAAFSAAFAAADAAMLTLPVMGAFLLLLSGLLDIAAGLGLRQGAVALSPRGSLLMGALALCAGGALFLAAAACRRPGSHQAEPARSSPLDGSLLLVPPVCLVVRLVLVYRLDSINPTLSAYYVELLALSFLTLAFYRLSSFAYGAGRDRRYLLYAGIAIVLCVATLADGHPLSSALLYAGGAVTLLGFLLLRLEVLAKSWDNM